MSIIHIEGDGAEPLFEAINASRFSASFKRAYIDEILTTPTLRFGGPGFEGLFESAGMTATEAGNFLVHVRASRTGELMISALPALGVGSSNEDHTVISSPNSVD
jgi:hypothetical protein